MIRESDSHVMLGSNATQKVAGSYGSLGPSTINRDSPLGHLKKKNKGKNRSIKYTRTIFFNEINRYILREIARNA